MNLVGPDALPLSRAYFTEFDRVTFSQVAWTSDDLRAIHQRVERKLKLLALTKSHVVVAASHLVESELAHDLIGSNPQLLARGVVVPALRSEFQSAAEFLASKSESGRWSDPHRASERNEMATLLDSTTRVGIAWSTTTTSGWFRDRLCADLDDERSLLRSCLRARRSIPPVSLSDRLRGHEQLDRAAVYRAANELGDRGVASVLHEYADFLYYLSGARAVRSEGVLPQENLLDFGLTELAGGKTRLSDMEVFFKIFIDLVKSVTGSRFPVGLLDGLSIDDVLDLHDVAMDTKFVEAYDDVQRRTHDGLQLRDPERLVLALREIEQYEHDLHAKYATAIDAELAAWRRARRRRHGRKALGALASLVVPHADVASIPDTAREIVVSGLKFSSLDRLALSAETRINQCVAALARCARRLKRTGSPVFLPFVDELKARYAERVVSD